MDQMDLHRFHFAFTIIFHYLFPQLSMGLSLLIFLLKTRSLWGDTPANDAARFWSKILGLTFVMGVVTGIPMEFQFGTNWSRFSSAAGGVIGQTLAMEGVFAFFLESTFVYGLLFGEKRLGKWGHWFVSFLVFFGTWLSGFFIVCTNAWMQHPVGYEIAADGQILLTDLSALFTNPWALPQYLHTMVGTTITASFVVSSIGAFYLLRGEHEKITRHFMKLSVVVGFIASVLAAFPTGDWRAQLVHKYQPVTFAAMEGHFHTEEGASLVLIGQPNLETLHLDNPIVIPRMLSILTHYRWDAEITGLDDFSRADWPDSVPGLYYAYHIMAGLGTIFIAIMSSSVLLLWQGKLFRTRWLLWALMLALPFPFIANTAGWITTEFGRQPWIIYGLMRTSEGYSESISTGNITFTLLGFMGMYLMLAVLYIFVAVSIIAKGPSLESNEKR